MWATIVILALALNLEPNRLGIIGLLILRPRPIRQLLAFLGTSFLTGATVGLLVLFLIHRGSFVQAGSGSAWLQIGMGTLALLAAGLLWSPLRLPGGGGRPGPVDFITTRMGRLVGGDSLALPAALGFGISLPSVDYVALLLLIGTSGAPPRVQVAALFTFLAVANAVLLIPMLGFVLAKERTLAALEGLRGWVLARSRRDYAALLAVVGMLLIAVGFGRL